MRATSNLQNYWHYFTSKKLLVVTVLLLLLTAVSGAVFSTQNNQAYAATCTANDIIRCGVTNRSDFKAKYDQNEYGDLAAVYSHYNIDATEVQFSAVEGVAYRDGTIKVGERVVATDAASLGRSQKNYSKPVNINGKTYHTSRSQDVFRQQSLPVLVVMDDEQRFQYAIVKDCANPMTGKPTTPPARPVVATPEPPRKETPRPRPVQPQARYKCEAIEAIRTDNNSDDSAERSYRFDVDYVAENTTLRDATFEIKGHDDQTVEPTSDSDTTISSSEVTFDTPGSKYVRAILHFDVNGRIRDKTSTGCAIKVAIPAEDEIVVCRDGRIVAIMESDRRDTDLPEASEECDEPEAAPTPPRAQPDIPSTGPAEAIGGTLGAGGIVGAGLYFKNSRRKLLASSFKS